MRPPLSGNQPTLTVHAPRNRGDGAMFARATMWADRDRFSAGHERLRAPRQRARIQAGPASMSGRSPPHGFGKASRLLTLAESSGAKVRLAIPPRWVQARRGLSHCPDRTSPSPAGRAGSCSWARARAWRRPTGPARINSARRPKRACQRRSSERDRRSHRTGASVMTRTVRLTHRLRNRVSH